MHLYLLVEGGDAEEENGRQDFLCRTLKYVDAVLFKKWNSTRAVSYTHLDVYKRQEICRKPVRLSSDTVLAGPRSVLVLEAV